MKTIPQRSRLNWAIQPFSRLIWFFLIGIIAGERLSFSWFGPCCLIFISAVIVLLGWRKRFFHATLVGIAVYGMIVSLGVLASARTTNNSVSMVADVLYSGQLFFAKVLPDVRRKGETIFIPVEIYSRISEVGEVPYHCGALIRCKSDTLELPDAGMFVFFRAQLSLPPEPLFPSGFDYRSYLNRKGISFIAQVNEHELCFKEALSGFSVRSFFNGIRKRLIQQFKLNGLRGDELAIASALLLGERTEISDELTTSYTASGIVHILAVSGMHVGLVFTALLFLLKPIKQPYVQLICMLLLIWSYAVLTGLSPSVVRASWMYSFIATGKWFTRGHQPWNSIAASAFLMLMVEPGVWADAGFQLSFSAVWGIVVLGKTPNWIKRRKWWIRHLLEAAWISTMAQLSTLPVSLYLFGKFPVYFLLSNLLAVPLSTLLTYWGIFSLICSGIPVVGEWCCWLLGCGIRAMNFVALTISDWPLSGLNGLYPGMLFILFLASGLILTSFRFLSISSKLRGWCFLYLAFQVLSIVHPWVGESKEFRFYVGRSCMGILLKHSASYCWYQIGEVSPETLWGFNEFAQRYSVSMRTLEIKHGFEHKINGASDECLFRLTCNDIDIRPVCEVFFVKPDVRFLHRNRNNLSPNELFVLMPGGSRKQRQVFINLCNRLKINLVDACSRNIRVFNLKQETFSDNRHFLSL